MDRLHRARRASTQKPMLIVFSHLRWDFVFQRPQHLLSRAARDFDVCFIEEPVFDGDKPTLHIHHRAPGLRVIQPVLPIGAGPGEAILHQGDIAEAMAAEAEGAPICVWYYTPMALAFGHRVAADVVIFDKMDELSAFAFAPPDLRAREASLLESADLVFTGGASLQAATVGRRADAHCFPSSIDTAHFAAARDRSLPEPADQAGIAGPRLGFFGVIDERIDLDLIRAVAAARPDWQLVMVGPTAKIDPAQLPRAANIHWLGGRDYADLPAYMAHWDLGWMPFALNESTRFISPTKTPEYLAAGLPVLSTPIHDVVEPYGRLGLVDIGSHADALIAAAERLLALDAPQRAARLAAVDAHLAGSSWDQTWASMTSLITAALAQRAPVSSPIEEVALV